MIAAIMQPTFLPWMGYFDLIDRVDQFVFLDDAQVLKRSWGVRNRIAGANGEAFLSVPLSGHSQKADCTFANTRLAPEPKWRKTHLATIRHTYGKAPFFAEEFPHLEALLNAGHETIGALNMAFITEASKRMGIATPFIKASKLDGVEGRKDDRLLSICCAIGAEDYLAAQGSAAYIEQERESGAFAGSGVTLHYHNFEHPTYPQAADPFISHMSVVDLLMHCGAEAALDIIRSGRKPMLSCADMRELIA